MIGSRPFLLSLAFACAAPFTFAQEVINLTPDPLIIEPGHYSYIEFKGGKLSGTFKITNPRKDVVCLVFDEEGFINWQNNHEAQVYYESGKVAVGSFSLKLPYGLKCYLVFSNTHSVLASSTVVVKANVFNIPYPRY